MDRTHGPASFRAFRSSSSATTPGSTSTRACSRWSRSGSGSRWRAPSARGTSIRTTSSTSVGGPGRRRRNL